MVKLFLRCFATFTVISIAVVNLAHCQMLDNVTCEIYDCKECYNLLVHNVLKSDINQYRMQRTFFPPDDATPVSVIVYYDYRNETGDIDESKQKVWFWTSSTFYHFQPVGVLQYLSLFFTDPSIRVSFLNITLDSQCVGANKSFMQLFTQRVCELFFSMKTFALCKGTKIADIASYNMRAPKQRQNQNTNTTALQKEI